MKKDKLKQNSAITLIALVVTIVVLLILSGISISAVLGKNGILDKAKEAKYLTKLREYEERVTLIVASEKTLKVTENKEERLIDLVYNKLDEQEWVGMLFVKEQDDELEENEIKVITTDNFRIIAQIDDDGKITFIEDGEPYPKIKLEQLPLEGNEDEKIKIKVNASVEKKGKTKKIEKIELIKEGTVLTERTYDNLEVEDIFEIETNGIYTFKATTDQAKSRSKKIEINIEETDSTIEIDHDIKTPRNTTEIGSKNGIETGPIQVTIKYEENGLKKQYKKENDEEWTNVENDVQVSFAVIENTTILARYYDGTNGFQIKRYKIENVDNEGPIIESKNITFENKNINITASATDVSGILRYEYSMDGENYLQTSTLPIPEGGTYKVWVKAIDKAGNETIESESITVSDYTLNVSASAGGKVSGDIGRKFENESCTVIATPNTGYSFLGWYEGNTKVSTSDTYTFNMPAKDYSIVAKFNSIVYKITYNANGGNGAPSAQTKSYGKNITLSTVTPTRNGYAFAGWTVNKSSNSVAYRPGDYYKDNSNIELYAIWVNLSECKKVVAPYNAFDNSWKEETVTIKAGKGIYVYIDGIISRRCKYMCTTFILQKRKS